MKIYQNPWVSRESYFVKTGAAKSAKMEAAKSSGYSIEFWEGKWVVRRAVYYDLGLRDMPVICENRCSLQSCIDKAILDTVLGFVEEAKMGGGDEGEEMTVKELKEKFEKLPDSAEVRLMTDSEDNPLQDYYDAKRVYYLKRMIENGLEAVYITPEH